MERTATDVRHVDAVHLHFLEMERSAAEKGEKEEKRREREKGRRGMIDSFPGETRNRTLNEKSGCEDLAEE